MKLMPLCIVLLFPVLVLAQSPVFYQISFDNKEHHEARVAIEFTGVSEQVLQVRMSRSSPGRYALHEFAKNVYDVKAVDSRDRNLAIERPNPHQWNISGHDGTVKVSYTIFGDRCDGTYLAIDNTHAHLNMPATFMWARGQTERPIEITFAQPEGWQIATQLEPTPKAATFRAPNLQYFLDSPTEIGPFQLRQWQIADNQTVRLALHHDGAKSETDAYADLVKQVVKEEIAIFGQAPAFDSATYTFICDYLPHVSGDGMEHRNSTICTSTRSLKEHAVRNLGTISHEFFHAWNVERIRPRTLEPFDFEKANMSGELWFAEGFTTYYGWLVMKRAQIISIDKFAESLGRNLNAVLNRPGREVFSPVEMSMRAPFVDAGVSNDPVNTTNIYISYYPFGAAIGLALDLTLRQRFQNISLDDFMRSVWQKHGVNEAPYSNADLRAILAEVSDSATFADDFFDRFVFGHELAEYESLLNAAGFLLRPAKGDSAWLGSARMKFNENKVTLQSSTMVGSPLYEAGLDRQDVILDLDGEAISNEDELKRYLRGKKPEQEVQIKFETNGIEKTARMTLQQNPQLEVLPVEQAGSQLTAAQTAFRENWLNSRAGIDGEHPRRHCPKCKRSYAFQFEYCKFDGKKLELTAKVE